MALAAMTESPMAVTCLPVTLAGVADGVGVPRARLLAPGAPVPEAAEPGVAVPEDGAEGDACAWRGRADPLPLGDLPFHPGGRRGLMQQSAPACGPGGQEGDGAPPEP